MTKRLQGFYIYKFNSKRLSKSKFNIQINIHDARKNSELVKFGDSAFLEVVRKVTNHPYDLNKLKQLDKQRRQFQKDGIKEELLKTISEIDKLLHIPEVVEISFDNTTHYKKIFNQGLFINGEKYVRILAGAANLRKNTVFFIQEKYKDKVNNILDCGRNKNQLFNVPKFSAYFGLYNSSGHSLSYPKFVVVPDAEYKRMVKMDWVNDCDEIEEIEKEVVFNLFDGQGLVLPSLSAKWARELELDWTPSTWILRAPFLKGSFVTFSFDEFGKYVAQKEYVRDVWGNEVSIDGIELIVSASQFKLWDSYPNQYSYEQAMKQNGLGFRSSRYSQPYEKMKTVSAMNYMFVQVLDLDKEKIKELCEPTINHFYDLMGGDREKMLTFLYPDNPNAKFDSVDPEIQALMLDEEFIKEPSIQRKFVNALRKQVRDAYLGNIFVEGNYQPMISDPYAQAEHIFGLDIFGLLNENENYCHFWNDINIDLVGSARSPLTHFSEFRKSKLVNDAMLRDWYRYIDNGFVLNTKGFDVLLYADSDFDGDLIFTTSNPIVINGIRGGNPISYDRKKVVKKEMNDENILEGDLFGFSSRIGFITNVSSTFHSMLYNFEKNSIEYNELQRRLKLLRKSQGEEIDSTKGIEKKPIPSHWTKWQRKEDSMSNEEKQQIDFDNSLIADKRPRFFRHLYSHLSIEYRKKNFEKNFWARQFGKSFDELANSGNLSKEELDGIDYYKRRFPFIENDSVMNMVEETMFNSIKENQVKLKKEKFNYSKILKKRYPCEWVEKYYKQYKYLKRVSKFEEDLNPLFNIAKTIKENIYSDVSANVDYVLDCVIRYFYEEKKISDTQFVWMFGDEIIDRLKQQTDFYVVPEKADGNGDFSYLWSEYKLKKVSLEKMSEEKI